MFFLQAAQAPVAVRIENRVYYLPKMTMDDLIAWGMDIVTRRVETITADMEDAKKHEYLSFYPITAPNIQEMSVHVRTVEGIKRVITQCFSSPDVKGFMVDEKGAVLRKDPVPPPTEQEISEWIVSSGIGRCAALAWELADMRDVSQENPSPKKEGNSHPTATTKSERVGSAS